MLINLPQGGPSHFLNVGFAQELPSDEFKKGKKRITYNGDTSLCLSQVSKVNIATKVTLTVYPIDIPLV